MKAIFVSLAVLCSFLYGNSNNNEIFLPSCPALSPDGKQITFSWNGDICSAETAGGTIKILSHHPATEYGSCFSPDGSKIAFSSDRTGTNQIYTMDAEGGQAQQVTFHSAGALIEQWANNETLMVSGVRDYFWRNGSRFLSVSSSPSYNEDLLFDAYGRDGRISPDGTKLMFVREGSPWYRQGYQGSENGQIWTYDLQTKEFELLLGHDGDYDYPAWGAEGKSVYYAVSFDNGPKNLWEYDLTSGVKRQLTNFTDGSVMSVTSSLDGSVIVFRKLFDLYSISPVLGAKAQKINLVAPAEDMPDHIVNQVKNNATDSAFTSDALEIAFVADRDIWVMDTELKEPVQVYPTPKQQESNLIFSKDNETLYFISDDGIVSNIYTARRSDPNSYWWQNTEFTIAQLTNGQDNIVSFTLSPDEKSIAYEIAEQGLWIADINGENSRKLINSWDTMDYSWSPKSTYIAYVLNNEDVRRDIWITPVDKSCPPYNVSRNPRDDGTPRFSPDGKYLAWLGSGIGDNIDIFYVPLQKKIADITPRDRTLEKAVKLMEEKRKSKENKKDAKEKDQPDTEKKDEADTSKSGEENTEKADLAADDTEIETAANEPQKKEDGDIIEFDDLYKRTVKINTADAGESCLLWIGGNKLLFNQHKNNNTRSYTIEIPEKLNAEKYSDKAVTWTSAWIKDAKMVSLINNGSPALLDNKELKEYNFSVKTELDRENWYELGFKIAWRNMRDKFYSNELLRKAKWDTMLDKYLDKAIKSPDNNTFGRVINLMLGELNASHMGFTAANDNNWRSDDRWQENTAHFGARFDNSYKGPGLKIRDILPESPAERYQSRLYPSEIITHIDGVEILPETDINKLLTGDLARDFTLTVKDVNDQSREVTIRPVSYNEINPMLKKQWINTSKDIVKNNSDGKLGYVYVPRMMWDEFVDFEEEIFAEGEGKDGMIIDVRDNGGGFTADHILTVLCHPAHSKVLPRNADQAGYNFYWKEYSTWDKPIVVLCNQNSFSNAEIFSHAIKTIKRGKLVGVPTAGGVIATGSRNVVDLGNIRMPFIGWYPLSTELDMELNGAIPDYIIWPAPGDMPAGIDVQLDKAIEVLKEEVEAAKHSNHGKIIPDFKH